MSHDEMRIKAEELVLRIPGTRRGSEEPAHIHSLRVAASLERYGFSTEVVIGGMLHDVVEDSETTFDELVDFGFSDRVIELVRLCSHDEDVEGSDARWVKMMAQLIEASDREAWAIKLADISDNLDSCHLLLPDRCKMMREAKTPLILALTQPLFKEEPIWSDVARKVS